MEGFKCYGPKDDRYIIRLGRVDKIYLEECIKHMLDQLDGLEKDYPKFKNDPDHKGMKAMFTSQLHALRNPERV